MKAVRNRVIVRIPKQYTDTVPFLGGELYKDPMFERTWNLMYVGTLIGIPDDSSPAYNHSYNRFVKKELVVGDKVYFHYVHADTDRGDIIEHVSGTQELVKSMPYGDIICVVREGVVIPVNGWCLGEPIIIGEGEVETIETSSGPQKVRLQYLNRALGLVAAENTEVFNDRCVVTHTSSYKDEDPNFSVGDTVIGIKGGINFKNTIEGIEYFCFQHDTVLGILS
jgi:hypothetical protein